ncbi:hypothetical protein [Lachnoclostridium sp.]|uniref:hypothetical protein n=1 Tax=Lachnoclostridium sp. TaxID=2028282 RepID=UPI00289F7141|nr:hypothetical protein [Lachnoclostridium sp.]
MKKKAKYSKFIVFIVIVLNAVFAYMTLNVFASTGSEPTMLITAWFAFTTGELWMLAGIKKSKSKTEEKDNEI